MWATLVLLSQLAAGPPVDVVVDVRSEGRGSLLRTSIDEPPVPMADLSLTPSVRALRDDGRWALGGQYSLDLRARATPDGLLPIWRQDMGLGAATGEEARGGRLELAGLMSVGQISFDTAGEDLDQPFGLGQLGGLVPLATGEVRATGAVVLGRRLRLGSEARVGAFAAPPLGDDRLPGVAPGGNLVEVPWIDGELDVQPQLLPEARLFGEYRVTRRDAARLEARVNAALDLTGVRYVGVTPTLQGSRRLDHNHDAALRAGAFVGQARPPGSTKLEPLVLPVLEGRLDGRLGPSVRQRVPQTGFGYTAALALEPFYDALLGVLTQRAALRAGLTWSPWAPLLVSAGLDSSAWLSPEVFTGGRIVDAHITTARLEARWEATRTFAVEAGTFAWLRSGAPGVPASEAVSLAPEFSFFIAVITRLPFEV